MAFPIHLWYLVTLCEIILKACLWFSIGLMGSGQIVIGVLLDGFDGYYLGIPRMLPIFYLPLLYINIFTNV